MRAFHVNRCRIPRRTSGISLPVVLGAVILSLATACSNRYQLHGLFRPDYVPPDHSRDPYNGTGVVVRVIGEGKYIGELYLPKTAYVDFGEDETPRYANMTLLVLSNRLLVGKLKSGSGGGGKTPLVGYGCELAEGTAEKGDTVIGLQHQREYKKAY